LLIEPFATTAKPNNPGHTVGFFSNLLEAGDIAVVTGRAQKSAEGEGCIDRARLAMPASSGAC
jgi:hypothetical protein